MAITMRINGVDILPYLDQGGYQWTRTDLDGEGAGRTLDGVMRRNRVCTKARLDITTVPLTTAQLSTLLNLIQPEFVAVTFTDPLLGSERTAQMYSNNIPAQSMVTYADGTTMWKSFSFPLIEK